MLAWLKRGSTSQRSTAASTDALIRNADAARERGDQAQAEQLYAQAHAAAPGSTYPLYWLATLKQERGDLDEAWAFGEHALDLDPSQVALVARMASIADDRLDPLAALDLYQRVAMLAPDYPAIDNLLADQYCHLGRIDEGVAAFDRAIAHATDPLPVEQARLFCLNFGDRLSPRELADEHWEWARKYGAVPTVEPAFDSDGRPGPLRIGYVSCDLRNHAVAYFVAPLLEHHDRSAFTISVFDTSQGAEDALTARMRAHVDHWHKVAALSDAALADAIRAQRIDVLFDLSGHTRGSRLRAFAHRAAPVQVSWLGYLATTGLPAMDYRMTDALMDPPGMTEALHTERLYRLPVQACFSPSPEAPDVGPPPSQSAPFTFGSVNQWAKVSSSTKDLWARILTDCPSARLFVIARGGQNPLLQRQIADQFARRGALASQVSVFPFGSTRDFLHFLNHVDVALDPFPYGGGTTTMQCLWMGVPVVTLAGATPMGRNSIGPLTRVGLADLVADSPQEYRRIAVALAADGPRLARLRRELRGEMAASPSMDAAAFARSVEDACRTMWAVRVARQD